MTSIREWFVLRALDPDHEWELRAACADTPDLLDTFTHPGRQPRDAEALAVCGRCTVLPQCQAAAVERGDTFGIRGGRRLG
ncbi:WhiB family transcriptional regulator [Nocardioides sp. Arc9.136]|uniref:WhiB family transcriptional regulator n=1 Tax=Nocardioides sp. Arc9.136 TaxID=2996826 RepID=UPI0026670860|nr:WhiB family transcriptional regulator [Nocardioides sp. Arc9.136]WKN47172.1 WhiB family transcriptional regulator [Nocardioides sp. Arc9.136]